jgi:hypothetical protein
VDDRRTREAVVRGLLLGLLGTVVTGQVGYWFWGTRGQVIGFICGVAFVILIGTLWFGPPGRQRP